MSSAFVRPTKGRAESVASSSSSTSVGSMSSYSRVSRDCLGSLGLRTVLQGWTSGPYRTWGIELGTYVLQYGYKIARGDKNQNY